MTNPERAMVKAMLVASGHAAQAADWMAASCPSVERARQICNEDRRRTIMRKHVPSPEAIAIREAHSRVRAALNTPAEFAALAELQAAIDAAYAVQERRK